ncbi:MAG: RNA polymerase factor sigma-54, partial [Candidatus Dadabacteria bacterium]|nr:RNA polymerase factor sigma-54 [Candidatus Dadabacteria bacterium]
LILTQELQLFLKLIQMTTLELREYLEEQLIENPLLEEAEEKNTENVDSNETDYEFKSIDNNLLSSREEDFKSFKEFTDDGEEEIPWENKVSAPQSLLDYLKWQIDLSDFSDEEKHVAYIIIGNTDEDGYLDIDLKETALLLAKHQLESSPDLAIKNPSEEEKAGLYENLINTDTSYIDKVEGVLKKIHSSFDPPGVCARNLKECLKIQAEELGYNSVNPTLTNIIEDFLEEVASRDYKKIADALGLLIEEVEQAASVISSFEPKPGRPFYSRDAAKYVVPDFYVYKVENDLNIQLNRDFPKVRISHQYRTLFKQGTNLSVDVKNYLKEKLDAAQRMIKCLEEREQVVKKVVKKIVEHQRDFFEYGKDQIKPLRLKDIAHDKDINVHESTVSRITSRRYIHTPQGIIELKSLFSRGIETYQGEEISFEKVKAIIKDIIATESSENPYSDEDISRMLERRNIKIARRTIAKYRKILKIPSSSERFEKKGGDNASHSNNKTYRAKQS